MKKINEIAEKLPKCHPERSEGSKLSSKKKILHYVQNDKNGFFQQSLNLPLTKQAIASLKRGDKVLLSGILYTARDAAHKRLALAIKKGKKLPLNLKGQTVYYTGPAPSPPGKIIGSCGPTTSSRMDSFTPLLIEQGLRGMIGKGDRASEVTKAIKRYGAVYFIAVGGAGALLSQCVKKAEVVAYKELSAEAIYRLEVKDFPVIVGIDCKGRDIYSAIYKT